MAIYIGAVRLYSPVLVQFRKIEVELNNGKENEKNKTRKGKNKPKTYVFRWVHLAA